MPMLYSFKCGPITARVYQIGATWTALVQLLGSERFREGILDISEAQNIGIAFARELCIEHDVTYPACLDAPEWFMARSAEA
jgi:hypothetical protein